MFLQRNLKIELMNMKVKNTHVIRIICQLLIFQLFIFTSALCRAEATPTKDKASNHITRMIAINPKINPNGLEVSFIMDGNISHYNAFPLSNPSRLVLDLFNIQPYESEGAINLNSSLLVQQLRWHSYEKNKMRMVFDLIPDSGLSYRIIPKEDRLIVYLGEVPDMPPVDSVEQIDKNMASHNKR